MKIEQKIIRALKSKRKTVSFAESCTGGLLANRLTSFSGASAVFGFGIVTYSGKAKQKVLKVPRKIIKKHGEVSEEVALAMAKGVKRLSKSDYAISITGIAGPSGGTRKKPVGTVYLSLLSKKGAHIKKLQLRGTRSQIQRKTAATALQWLYKFLTKK